MMCSTKTLLGKQIACFSFPWIVLFFFCSVSQIYSAVPFQGHQSGLGEFHSAPRLQLLLVRIHAAAFVIISSSSLLKNLDEARLLPCVQMWQAMETLPDFCCYLPVYFPTIFQVRVLDIFVMKQIQDTKSPCLHVRHVSGFPYRPGRQFLINCLLLGLFPYVCIIILLCICPCPY